MPRVFRVRTESPETIKHLLDGWASWAEWAFDAPAVALKALAHVIRLPKRQGARVEPAAGVELTVPQSCTSAPAGSPCSRSSHTCRPFRSSVHNDSLGCSIAACRTSTTDRPCAHDAAGRDRAGPGIRTISQKLALHQSDVWAPNLNKRATRMSVGVPQVVRME
jgi:hypothetical protein